MAFKILGWTAWVRSFTMYNFLSFLPQAISFTRLQNNHYDAASRFKWITLNWSQTAGWVTSVNNIGMYAVFISNWRNKYGIAGKILGVLGLALEVAGWTIFVLYRKPAIRYAKHLATQAEENFVDY